MCRAVVGLVFGILAMIGLGQPAFADEGKRVALVIGNDSYANLGDKEQLLKARNDAEAVGKALKDLDFEVISGSDLNRFEFNKKLQEFAQVLKPGDTAALFFSGHGVQIQNANFLLPSDIHEFQSDEEELLKREAISLQSILEMLEEKGTRINIVILDACRNNPFSDPKFKGAGGTRGLTRVDPPTGTFVMFSAGTNQTALDRLSDADPDPNSVYTRSLLPLLKRPNTPIQSLAKRIQVEVRDLAKEINHKQEPAYYDQVIGDYELDPSTNVANLEPTETPNKQPQKTPEPKEAAPSKPVAPQQPAPPQSSTEQRKQEGEYAYLDCVRSNDLPCYKKFLADYPGHPRAIQVEKIIKTQVEYPLYQACIESTTAITRIRTCQTYLDAFPGGQYVAQVQALLDEAQKALPRLTPTPTPQAALPPEPEPAPQPQPQATPQSMSRMSDTDLFGGDIEAKGIRWISVDQCESRCLADDNCKAYTYVQAKQWCWPKYTVTSTQTKYGMISGVKSGVSTPAPQRASTTGGRMDRIKGYDLYGGDLTDNGLKSYSLEDCEAYCQNNSNCRAYSWVRDKQWCWPKYEFGSPQPKRGVISGRKL